jgi:hypothetical protein
VSQTSRPVQRTSQRHNRRPDLPAGPPEPISAEPADPRPSRRRPPENASWACLRSVDVLLPLMIVLLLVAAVAGAVGLTYVAL